MLASLIGIAVLTAIATAVLWLYGVPHRWAPAAAILRGALQVTAVSLALSGLLRDPLWIRLGLLVMFGAAAATATGRLGWGWRRLGVVGGSMLCGCAVALGVVFGTGALAFTPRYSLALGGIVIGNSMTIATLAGRRFAEIRNDRWDEVEGWLALGATPRQATHQPARHSVYSALIPTTDQTRTTGLVTLPGAFVGAIFGGVSPLEAGRFQIIVLAAIMTAGAITAVLLTMAHAGDGRRPEPPR